MPPPSSSMPEESSVRSTSIEPITSTEPTTTPRQETSPPEQPQIFSHTEPDQSHIQHIPLRDEHAENSDDSTTEMLKDQQLKLDREDQQNELNQISNEQDDVVKDLNNFRHPATLITASNSNSEENSESESEKQVETTAATTAGTPATSTETPATSSSTTTATTTTEQNEREEDPYHVHILSENHDRLAEHEDYQMLSTSTEESSSTTTTTTTESGIVVSQENKATAEPSTATESTTTTTTTSATTSGGATTSRARAMHMNEPENENEMATTIMPDSESGPMINIVEGQHRQQETESSSTTEADTTTSSPTDSSSTTITTTTTTTTEPSPFVAFAGEGRSAGGNDDVELFLHHNSNATHEQIMDLSDVNMEEDQNESSSSTTTTTTTTTSPTTTAQPETEMPKIVEITASGDTMQRECLANNRSYKVREQIEKQFKFAFL